jgi:hypothetical protein
VTARRDWGWLRHPLVLTLVGAILSVLIVPAFTRQWQDRQKERELKRALVADIGASVTEALKTSQFVNLNLFGRAAGEPASGREQQRVFNESQIEWEIQSARIGSQLRAYFPGTGLGRDWQEYSETVTKAYQLVSSLREGLRDRWVDDVRAYLRARGREPDLEPLRDERLGSAGRFPVAYETLVAALLGIRDELVQRVLDTNAAGFDTDVLPFRG